MKFDLSRYTLDCFFAKVLEKYPTRPALAVVGEIPFSYAEFGEKVNHLRNKLYEAGIRKGSRVAILGNSSPHWGIAFLSITTLGAIAVPIMEDFPDTDIDHILRHSEAESIFISQNLLETLSLPAIDYLNFVINLQDFEFIRKPHPEEKNMWSKLQDIPGKILKTRDNAPVLPQKFECQDIEEDDIAEILYTSGTTGHSKGVMLTHRNLVSNLFEGPDLLGVIDENSVILSFLPLAHAFGSTSAFLSIIYCGASICYLNRKPSPKILMEAMQLVKPTIIGAVPLIFEKIYHKRVLPVITEKRMLRILTKSHLGRKLVYRKAGEKIMESFGGRLKCAIIGGASLNREVEMFLRTGGIPYAMGYGLSECSPLVAFSSIEGVRIGSVGQPINDVEIKILDPNPKTGVGEILTKGPNVMKGYYKNEQETRKVFTEDGWFITGDRGYLDKDGYLYIKGRSKNVIIEASGENIYPEVIEEKLKESLFVEEALVHMSGNELIARIYPDYEYIRTLEEGKEENAIASDILRILEDVRLETNRKLPPTSKIQKIFEQAEPFVKTPTNKIKRAEYIPDYLSGY